MHDSRVMRDISIAMGSRTPEWPGDTPFSCGWTWRIRDGSSVNVSAITSSPHVGTHADAPLHVRDGWPASDALPLDAFVGRAVVCTVRGDVEQLTLADLPTLPREERIERLLLRTNRSVADGHFPDAWPAFELTALQTLLDRGLRLLGVDAPSVDPRESKSLDAHHLLFEHGANVLENLDLRDVADGEYELIALPIKMQAVDAAPVRAVLRRL